MSDLLTEADFVVYGADLVPSILAAALAKAGKKVLHLDAQDRFGGLFASPSLEDFRSILSLDASTPPSTSTPTASNSPFDKSSTIKSGLRKASMPVPPADDLGRSAKFSLDLNPRLVLAAGPFVDFLVQSGTGPYLEFKLLEGTFAFQNASLRRVPLTKSDIFQDRTLAPLEKRSLMKFLTTVQQHVAALRSDQGRLQLDGEGGGTPQPATSSSSSYTALKAAGVDVSQPFSSYLAAQGLSKDLGDMIEYAVALSQGPPTSLPTLEGLLRLARYVESIGRFGPNSSPFLVPLYGTAEFPQVLVRTAAVQGVTYILRQGLNAILSSTTPPSDPEGSSSSGQGHSTPSASPSAPTVEKVHLDIDCIDHDVSSGRILSAFTGLSATWQAPEGVTWVRRGVLVLDKPLCGDAALALVVVPPAEVQRVRGPGTHAPVYCLQLGPTVDVCPPGRLLLHLIQPTGACSDPSESPEVALRPIADALLAALPESARPSVLFSAFFEVLNASEGSDTVGTATGAPANLLVAPPPPMGLTLEPVLSQVGALASQVGLPGMEAAFGLQGDKKSVDSDEEDVGELENALKGLHTAGTDDTGGSESDREA